MRLHLLVASALACACSTPGKPETRFVDARVGASEAGRPVATAATSPPPQRSSGIPRTPGIFQLTLGGRDLEDSRWGSLDNQFALGLDYTWKYSDSPIGLNFGWTGAGDRTRALGTDIYAWQGELTLGPRFYVDIPKTPIFFHAGVAAAVVYSELSVPFFQRESDTQFGVVGTVGANFKVTRYQSIGIEWRTLQGTDFDNRLPGSPNDSNYQQLSLTFSAAF